MALHKNLIARLLAAAAMASGVARAQVVAVSHSSLTIADAEQTALKNQPRMLAAQLRARASAQRVTQARSALLPNLAFNATGVRVADTGTSTAAGNITTSAISGRFAYGGNLTQLVTDFGRTSALVGSTNSQAEAQADFATLTKAQVRLNVRSAYYGVLGTEAVLRAAQAALDNRTLIARQLGALAQSQLRSTLDVNFASVLQSQAQLAVVRAQSQVAQQRARLSTTMGAPLQTDAPLQPVTAGDAVLPLAPEDLVPGAVAQRADLSAARAQEHSAQQFALAEKRLRYPTLNVLAAAGDVPFHDHTLHDNYAAAGFNLNVPIFNGGLFSARRNEANLEAEARSRDVQAVQLEVNEQVRTAWYRADEAFRAIAVTDKLVTQSQEALRLAQARYDAGLSGIVELNEAQLNETSAEIAAADANYSYLTQRAQLDFAAGLLN